jgi:hypothetical protein
MRKVALIVEGHGDVNSVPSLISRAASAFDMQVIAANPIRGGEAKKLRRPGELERHLRLAASRKLDSIMVVVDLDDGCAKEFAEEFNRRAQPIAVETGIPIDICFCIREYETWLLQDIGNLALKLPEYGIDQASLLEAEKIRSAKEVLRGRCKTKGYKQIRDQLIFTKKIDILGLGIRDRSFRKFLKSVTGLSYVDLRAASDSKTPAA